MNFPAAPLEYLRDIWQGVLNEVKRVDLFNAKKKEANRFVGVQTIAVSVQEDPDTIEDVVEPFLIRIGLLARTPRGRLATAAVVAHEHH